MKNVFFLKRRLRWRFYPRLALPVTVIALGCLVMLENADDPQWRSEDPATLPRVLNGGGATDGRSQSAWSGLRREPMRVPGTASSGAILTDRVTHVRDGDTIVVGSIPVRIANLDCAESATISGERASRRAKDLIFAVTVTCRLEGRRSYDREVGVCSMPDGQDFGEIMISKGYCSRWRG